jgi:hypothetical protein
MCLYPCLSCVLCFYLCFALLTNFLGLYLLCVRKPFFVTTSPTHTRARKRPPPFWKPLPWSVPGSSNIENLKESTKSIGGVAQLVDHLPSKCQALSSTSNIAINQLLYKKNPSRTNILSKAAGYTIKTQKSFFPMY